MRFATMWTDVLPSLVKAPATERYPYERRQPPDRLRALLLWDPEKCTGCGLCAMDCPSEAIEMIVLDKKAKRFVMRLHLDRCAFCGQCTYSCRQDALKMPNGEWELAALDRDALTLIRGERADVEEALGIAPATDPVACG
jgi:formate hydrogenlyase subunit 6/NADH:ubiquinone oxidoreductase subunit I